MCAGPFFGKPYSQIQAPPLELLGSGAQTQPVLVVDTTLFFTMTTPATLRKTIRQQRRTLSDAEHQLHADLLFAQLTTHPLFKRSKRIAGFIASDGEISPEHILDRALELGRSCYLPVLNQLHGNRLWFAPFHAVSTLTTNRYGIAEPALFPPKPVPIWSLDLALTPLVAFDRHGGRIGMGGGYYDRTFSHPKRSANRRRPFLLGIAHSFQETEQIQLNPWDVPLDGIATEKGITIF